jgi:hypothetical protein
MANSVFNSLKELYESIADGYDHIEFRYKNVWIRCGYEAYDDYTEYHKKYFPDINSEYKYAAYMMNDNEYSKNNYVFKGADEIKWKWYKTWGEMFENFTYDGKTLGELLLDESSTDFGQD